MAENDMLADDKLSKWDKSWQTGDRVKFFALESFSVHAPSGYFEVEYTVDVFEILDCAVVICVDGEATFDFTRRYEEFTLSEDHYDKVMYLP